MNNPYIDLVAQGKLFVITHMHRGKSLRDGYNMSIITTHSVEDEVRRRISKIPKIIRFLWNIK